MKTAKSILGGLALLAIAALLIFGPRSDQPPIHDRVVVQYWEKWTGTEAAQMQEIVDWFNDTVGRDQRIYVQYLSISSVNQKTLVATAAGVPPDVAGLWDNQVAQFAAVDALEPLDDLAAAKGITAATYKPVYWNACHHAGRLYALISTPADVALHYNKQIFQDHAAALRAAGLDPLRPPRTLQELDRYAQALDVWEDAGGGRRRLVSSGYLPLEPGWFITYTGLWFGVSPVDEATGRLQLDDPRMIAALEWIRGYSRRLGIDAISEFRSGLGQFNSTQNPFLVGQVAMVQQGPWMANYIETLRPSMNRWKSDRDADPGLPPARRAANCAWGAAPFPSAVPGLENVTVCGFDTLVIPRGARHPREAFEFIAFVNRQDVMERLNSLHCKNSPLAKVSRAFVEHHPNPYIEVFEKLALSPNAHAVPDQPLWPQIGDELNNAIQEVALLRKTPREALAVAQQRAQAMLDRFHRLQALRRKRGTA